MRWDTMPGAKHTGAGVAEVRKLRGMQSRIAGEHFEDMIRASLDWYRDRGLAHIEKTPEPMKPLRPPNKQGQFLACYTKAAQPDFKGTMQGGRSVAFEAKHTDSDRIEYSRLTSDQMDSLELHDRLGAHAFVLVSFGLQDFYRVPWSVWRSMKAIYGRKHMKRGEMEPFRVPYLSGVIKLLEDIECVPRSEVEPISMPCPDTLKAPMPDICVVCGEYAGEGSMLCPRCRKETQT